MKIFYCKHVAILRKYLKNPSERRDFTLTNIRRMMAAIYAVNLPRRSITSAGIAGSGAAMKTRDQNLSDVQCHNCSMFGQ